MEGFRRVDEWRLIESSIDAPDDTALDGTALDDTASELALPDYPVVVGPDADVEPDQYVFDVSYLRASDLAIEATVTVAATGGRTAKRRIASHVTSAAVAPATIARKALAPTHPPSAAGTARRSGRRGS